MFWYIAAGAFVIVEMLYSSDLLALVGAGEQVCAFMNLLFSPVIGFDLCMIWASFIYRLLYLHGDSAYSIPQGVLLLKN